MGALLSLPKAEMDRYMAGVGMKVAATPSRPYLPV